MPQFSFISLWRKFENKQQMAKKTFGRFIYEVIRYAAALLQELQHVFTIIPGLVQCFRTPSFRTSHHMCAFCAASGVIEWKVTLDKESRRAREGRGQPHKEKKKREEQQQKIWKKKKPTHDIKFHKFCAKLQPLVAQRKSTQVKCKSSPSRHRTNMMTLDKLTPRTSCRCRCCWCQWWWG